MEKVIKDGKVAILYSPGYGAGWSSWGAPKEALFHPKLVELVEAGKQNEITDELVEELFGKEFYTGGASQLTIEWLPEGTAFQIDEYDGYESVSIRDQEDWNLA